MRLTTETLTLFFLLVPGFVSSAVLNTLVVRQTTGRVSYVIEALVFSFLIYACLAPFFGGSPVSVEVTPAEGRTTYRPTVDPSFLICAMGLAVLFALTAGASITHDFRMRTTSSLSCSRSSSSVRRSAGGSASRPGRMKIRREENSMGSEPIEIEERGYNPPPVAKVERPTPSPAAPRPSPRAPAPREHS